jgi:polysaccharide biosynthesis protein PelF
MSDRAATWTRTDARPADVCLIVEGCYPFVPGGVSSWIDWLIRTQPSTSFSIVSLWPAPSAHPPRYAMPPNAVAFHPLYLQTFGSPPVQTARQPGGLAPLSDALQAFISKGGNASLRALMAAIAETERDMSLARIFNSPVAWDLVQGMYRGRMPYGSFLHYFWAWRALLGGLFATLEFPLPEAKVYHTISTGYAGLLAARAGAETGRPVILTEHGIYTNERRIELLMADWVADTIDKGHALDDPRFDLRDMWVHAFEAYARTCYEACDKVITLYEDNQKVQRLLGADAGRCRVIANGIDVERFGGAAMVGDTDRPTMALIGRVVPIKDVKAYITAAKILRERVPDLRAYILGPLDEDPDYTEECRQLAADLGLDGCVEFTGAVNIVEYLGRIHVAVLTSLSESQPLTILEAGAAGIPFVATNVGSCREIIDGRSDEQPALGPGGFITPVVDPAATAEAVGRLLDDHGMRRNYGETLRKRVRANYTSERAARAYTELYHTLRLQPTRAADTTQSTPQQTSMWRRARAPSGGA